MKTPNPFQSPRFTRSDDPDSHERIPTISKLLFVFGILLPYFVYYGSRIAVQDDRMSVSFQANFYPAMLASVGFGVLLIAISICRLEASIVEKVCLIMASIFAMPLLAIPLELAFSLIF